MQLHFIQRLLRRLRDQDQDFFVCVLWYVFLLLCYQFIRATVSAQRALSVLFTSCQFVMLLSIFYEQLNDDEDTC